MVQVMDTVRVPDGRSGTVTQFTGPGEAKVMFPDGQVGYWLTSQLQA